MKSFIRENPTIAFGLGLPLLLVLVFVLVSGIPNLLVASPQFDVLYATGYFNNQNIVRITVAEQEVQVIHLDNAYANQMPRLWRYNPRTGAVQEIAIVLPPDLARTGSDTAASVETPTTTVIDVPELSGLTIDSSSIAPDGYEFVARSDRYSGNVFGGLFYSRRYRHEVILTKDGRVIRLPNASDQYYSRNTQFVGWVVSQ